MSTAAEPGVVGTPRVPVSRDAMVLRWVGATTVSWFGDAVWTVALAWTAAHRLEPAVAGLVIAAELIPQATLVLLGGVLADRLDPRRMQLAGQLGRAVVLLGGAALWQLGLTGASTLFAIAVTFGVVTGLTIPSGPAFVRQLVAPEDLATVSGWTQIGNRVARLLGAPVGGVLVAWRGPQAAMVVDAVTFLLLAGVLRFGVRPRYELPRAAHARWRDSLADGLDYLRNTRAARLFVIGLTALNVFVTPVTALGLALNVSTSGWGPRWLGIADGALAAGAILGSLASIRWQPEHAARAGFRILVVQGIALAVVGVSVIPVVVAAMFVVGLTAGAASVWLSASFLRTVDPSQIGRVSSVSSLGDMTLSPLSVPALGAIAATASVLAATVVFGVAMSVLCLWFATRSVIAGLT